MNHAIIVAHPNPKSFTLAVAAAYSEAAKHAGRAVLLRDLYRMKFDPCLGLDELPLSRNAAPRADVVTEREQLADIDVFAFIYPFWFNAPPAILKGYLDRVFGLGFAYRTASGGTEPMLKGKRMISFTSSGAPDSWVRQTAALQVTRRLLDEHFAEVCGLTCIDHIHFGGIVSGITHDFVARNLATVRSRVEQFTTQPR